MDRARRLTPLGVSAQTPTPPTDVLGWMQFVLGLPGWVDRFVQHKATPSLARLIGFEPFAKTEGWVVKTLFGDYNHTKGKFNSFPIRLIDYNF